MHHVSLLGQTGTGKSTMLQAMALSDARSGAGVCLIDPHGDLAEAVFNACDRNCFYVNLGDPFSPWGYNPLTAVSKRYRALVADGFLAALEHQWADAWGPRMENLLRWTLMALLEMPRATISDIIPMLTDRDYRKAVVPGITDPECRRFWDQEFGALRYTSAFDGVAPITNKLGAFLSHPILRGFLVDDRKMLRFRTLMDEGTVTVISLAKGRVGAKAANVMGGLFLAAIQNAAFTRVELPPEQRRPFHVLVDEHHAFTTASLAEGLSEARKYGLSYTLAAQHRAQASPEVRASLWGNIGTHILFRLGPEDARTTAPFFPPFTARDIENLPNHRAYCRLLVGGERSRAFSMETVPPITSVIQQQ